MILTRYIQPVRRNWSPAASLVLAAFLVVGFVQLNSHHLVGAAVGLALAVLYIPARAVRVAWAKALRGNER